MTNKKSGYIDSKSKELKVASYINILSCLSLMLFALYYAEPFTTGLFNRIYNGSYYVEATKFGPFLILGIPALLSLIISSVLLVINKLKRSLGRKLGLTFVIFAFLALISSFIMWPIINHQLDKHNYSYCFHYTGSNMFSPPVYVKHPSYCHTGARGVTKELFAWFDQQEAAGVEVQPVEVLKKIQELKQEKGTDW